jgi:cytochrome c peroxidase
MDHLRSIFYRMGFNDQEIVCLSGAHALGRCHERASGYTGPWTRTPTTFTNAYYILLRTLQWVPKVWDGPFQYVDARNGRLMMLPTYVALLEDGVFSEWVEIYANDAARFFADFSTVFQKLTELGTTDLTPTTWF